jgi:hypothetical protein
MKRSRFSLFRLLWPAVALLAGLMLVAVTMVVAQTGPVTLADAPGGIEGFLYEPNGITPVGGGWIDIHDVEGQPWMGADTAPNGSFSIPNLPPGEYILSAYPPPGSDYAASLPKVVEVLSGQWATATLLLTKVRISGWVQDSDTGDRIAGVPVVAHDDDWTVEQWDTTNITGEYKIGGVEIGVTYTLEVFPPPGSEYVPLPIHYTAVPTATDVVLEMHIPPTNVVGLVHDPTGAPVPGAGVVVWNELFWDETSADELGGFLFRGLPTGEFWLHAAPPWGVQGLLASDPFSITIPTPTTLVDVGVITLPYAYKTVIGQVVFEGTSAGVPDAMVQAHRLDGPGYADTATDPTGVFTLSLAGGEWHLGAEPLHPPVEWIFPGPPAWIVFELPPTEPETKTATLEVIHTNAWVTGRVVCPGGVPCTPGDPPHEAIWVELRSDEIGNSAGLGLDYRFAIPIPDGWYELVVHVDHPELQGPEPVPVFVGPGGSYDVGDVALLLKDARITGQVRNEFGAGVEGIPVVGWQPEGFGWGWAETDVSGYYTMPVIGGEWFVEPQPGPELPYVFRHHPRLVSVAPGGTMAGVDFALTNAEARIKGIAVDTHSHERIWGLDGWAWAERIAPAAEVEFFSDAPMWDGGFELQVRGDEEYYVGLEVPPHAPYVSGSAGPVYVAPGAHVSITVPLKPKDAVIEGQLLIAGTTEPALGVWAEVFGEDEQGNWVTAGVDPGSAGYALAVVSGTWHLRAWVDPESGYVAEPTPVTVTVQSGQVVPQPFEVWPIEASISGQVLKPDGTPLPGAFVFAEGESPFVGHFEAQGWSDEFGNFELFVPEGGYVVGAALPGDELEAMGWLNPPPIDVPWVSTGSPATGLELRFRQLDAEIHGTVTFAPGIVVTPTHPAYVWGWAESGEWAETEAVFSSSTATYTLRVVSGTVWHVGAVYEDWDNGLFYESPEEVVGLMTTDQATQDLELGGPWPLPQPIIVTFDGTQMQTIVLPDGVELSIPPGALVVSGTVTLFIFPTREMRPEPGHEIIGAGYEMWAVDQNGQEITQFNKNVVMTFHYPPDVELAQQGISEHQLVPVYYSTLVGHWILADSYVVDTANNEITLQIGHFTKFGVASVGPERYRVYLPIVLKSGS